MLPIFEQCGNHQLYINKPLYIYNLNNPIGTNHAFKQELRSRIMKFIYSKSKYAPLNIPPYIVPIEEEMKADLLILNKNGPDLLRSQLNQIALNLSNVGLICAVCADDPATNSAYQAIKADFPDVELFEESKLRQNANGFLEHLSNYILLCSDTATWHEPTDMTYCVKALKKTHAYAFYLSVTESNLNPEAFIKIDRQLAGFQFKHAKIEHSMSNFTTLYRKTAIAAKLNQKLSTLFELERDFLKNIDLQKVGLCLRKPTTRTP